MSSKADPPKFVGIEIDQAVMVAAVKQVVEKGLAEGVGSWETQRLIREAVEASLNTAELPRLIQEALTGRMGDEAPKIVTAIVEDTMPMMQAAFGVAFQQALRGMIYGLLRGAGRGGYETDEEKSVWKRTDELMAGLGREPETEPGS